MNQIDGKEPLKPPCVAIVVAHPDDETLWCGGLLLSHPEWSTFIVTLCRGEDFDRSARFRQALVSLRATGAMGNLDDGVDQYPLSAKRVQDTILSLLPKWPFDLLLTHAPQGEYTWHRRHGEVSLAMHALWRSGQLQAKALWQFAYEDGGGSYPPRPQSHNTLQLPLTEAIWNRKLQIITEVYGFGATSWEARAASRVEAFNCFTDGGPPNPALEQSLLVNP
ncbi:PIG-L deacetylase family protein [Geothrix limicola]|uniref:PIG-L deacetylase family protein n=1 Tax=Geothrix limicola TaxID=2927978 RepID=UPI002552E11A|nr:PIG-L family deacetylase [Geothrix limicola]